MDSEKLPLWKMALLAAPDSFGVIPANFTPKLPPQKGKNDKIAENERKSAKTEEKLTLYYTAIKTQQCIDEYLSFSEGIATAYFRISENKSEKVFLKGNAFLAKTAKAVFEKNEVLFIEACETNKDENYFLECAKALEKLGFIFEGHRLNKNSWLDLYKAVLLLTEEYLSTKCELPSMNVVEIEENSNDLKIIFASDEEDLKDATLLLLESVPCSSDFLAIGAAFFDFLEKKMPADMMLLEKLYPVPMPDSFVTGIMAANKFGAYKDKKIYISHRLALDSLRNPTARFILLLTMLHEYGHFLDDVLHEREGMAGGDSEGDEGKIFACKFIENILNTDFKFADFIVPNPKGEELQFDIKTSDLSFEEKKGILSIFEYIESLEDGNLELPSGETIENAEFFGLANMPGIANKAYNAVNKTHQNLTITGAKAEKVDCNQYLTDGSIWPDFPTTDPLNTDIPYALKVLASGKDSSEHKLAFESHFGKYQHWHSMCPKYSPTKTNAEVRNTILDQAQQWYSKAIKSKKEKKISDSLFELGKLCHMVQDSFVLSHSWRRYIGDEKFMEISKIEKEDNGKIWTFQDYECQDGNYHALADCPMQKNNIQTIGYKSAEYATKEIMQRYAYNLEWHERYSAITPLRDYLSKIYEICSERENLPSGGSHPWFQKNNLYSREHVQELMTDFSMEIE